MRRLPSSRRSITLRTSQPWDESFASLLRRQGLLQIMIPCCATYIVRFFVGADSREESLFTAVSNMVRSCLKCLRGFKLRKLAQRMLKLGMLCPAFIVVCIAQISSHPQRTMSHHVPDNCRGRCKASYNKSHCHFDHAS